MAFSRTGLIILEFRALFFLAKMEPTLRLRIHSKDKI